MGRTLGRTAAFRALWRAVMAGQRGPGLWVRLGAMPRMIWATITGRYDGAWRLFLMALGMLYVVSPIDALPELFLAFVGLIDDAFVIAWIAGAFLAETERFLAWEEVAKAARSGTGTWPPPGQTPPPGRTSPLREDIVEGEVV